MKVENSGPGKVIGLIVVGFILVLAGTWIAQGSDWFLFKVFAPKYEQVRRQTFEQSRAFNQGMVQELENMQVKYMTSNDPKGKEALASIILHRASGYDLNDPLVTDDLRNFIKGLRDKQTGAK